MRSWDLAFGVVGLMLEGVHSTCIVPTILFYSPGYSRARSGRGRSGLYELLGLDPSTLCCKVCD